MLTLTIDDFAGLFGVSGPVHHSKIALVMLSNPRRDYRYRRLMSDERDRLIAGILKDIDSASLAVAGPHRQGDWEHGWAENLEEYSRTRDVSALTPKFIREKQPVRLDGDYAIPYSDSFEFDFVDVLRRWLFHEYFRDKPAIYDFGCGSCQNLAVLAEMFPTKRLYGLDWATSSLDIINKFNEFNDRFFQFRKITGQLFDLFSPHKWLKLEPGSAVFTVGTMEQLGCNFEPFLQFLLSNPVSVCVHLETIRELYDENNLLDYLAIKYDEKRGYLKGFLTRLRELAKEGGVEIIRTHKIFGNLYHDGYSLLVWRPAKKQPGEETPIQHLTEEMRLGMYHGEPLAAPIK